MGEIGQLVRRAKRRDPDAFTELMQLHERDIYRTASAIMPQDADIADALQETILTCWEKIDTLQNPRYFKTWMMRILINKCRDILRSGRRMVCVEELPEQEAKGTVEAEANLEWKEALRGLEEKYRLIVVLFYAEGLRTAEIGRLLQLPDSTVRTRLARGREQLAKYYAETEEQTRYEKWTQQYEQENAYTEMPVTVITYPEEYDGQELAYCIADAQFYCPECVLTDEELLQLIDLEHKNLYIYQRIQREIERGERAGWPQKSGNGT